MAVLGAAIVFFLMLWVLGIVFDYEIKNEAIYYRLFRIFKVGRIDMEKIKDVQAVNAWPVPNGAGIPPDHTLLFAVRWPSKVFNKSCVYIRTKDDRPRVYILSPNEPAQFADEIRRCIEA